MPETKYKLLVIEDDYDLAGMLKAYFNAQNYDVSVANWGEDGVQIAQTSAPDLVILDIRLPDIDGFEVASQLRANRKTEKIPIIFLTARRNRLDRLRGLELGADDYIDKPFDLQELLLRVRNALKRAKQDSLTNTITGLPEGRVLEEKLQEVGDGKGWVVLFVSLLNLSFFRDAYGFVASDDALRAVSLMLQNALDESASAKKMLLGHLSTEAFVVILGEEQLAPLQERIRTRLEQSLEYFYPIKDRQQISAQEERLSFWMQSNAIDNQNFIGLEDLRSEFERLKQKKK